ncbi:MAG: DUF2520 domain-containing protein [Cellulosilyticum sp.]|nr:DUF2520 domain-containing protein [Cellulosilyticum sp.]
MKKRIGFIGAGKVGFSLGRYFKEHHMDVSGYYSQNPNSAQAAAEFTHTKFFEKLEHMVGESEVIFVTVPDTMISKVWEQLKQHPLQNKIVCHCSGALTSDIFSDIDVCQAYAYSIHPLFAIHDRFNSYKELSKCLFTIEGNEKYLSYFSTLFSKMGNSVQMIPKQEKVRYHMAAAMASNMMVALVHICERQLQTCGFSEESARDALAPILMSNMQHIVSEGCVCALTGPLERCDINTVEKHLGVLTGNEKEIYKCLSKALITIAKKKNPERSYDQMEGVLE